jgi:hypothetical protein
MVKHVASNAAAEILLTAGGTIEQTARIPLPVQLEYSWQTRQL